jgi:hypothetical protein
MLDRDQVVPRICEELAKGLSLSAICAEQGFPNRSTIQRWCDDDPDIAAAITRARDLGFDERADQAVEKAKSAKDAALGRLAFDADRWYLAKLNPQRYGERIQTAQTDVNGNDAPAADPAQSIAAILAAARERQAKDGSDLA